MIRKVEKTNKTYQVQKKGGNLWKKEKQVIS